MPSCCLYQPMQERIPRKEKEKSGSDPFEEIK
jgi:hypothetical protein